jgi:abortive infection bacteriophage resistance protein
MSFGQLSFWYSSIKLRQDRKKIASYYSLDDKILASFLHHLSYVRNICAHHGRLWNRKLVIKPSSPRQPVNLAAAINTSTSGYLYNTLVMLEYMMNIISPDHHWGEKLKRLINKNALVNVHYMGFPDNWLNTPAWNNKNQSFLSDIKSRLCRIINC